MFQLHHCSFLIFFTDFFDVALLNFNLKKQRNSCLISFAAHCADLNACVIVFGILHNLAASTVFIETFRVTIWLFWFAHTLARERHLNYALQVNTTVKCCLSSLSVGNTRTSRWRHKMSPLALVYHS